MNDIYCPKCGEALFYIRTDNGKFIGEEITEFVCANPKCDWYKDVVRKRG